MKLSCSDMNLYALISIFLTFAAPAATFRSVGFSSQLKQRFFLETALRTPGCYGKKHESSKSPTEDDGYSTRFGKARGRISSSIKSVVKRVLRGRPKPGTLILVRHGETLWNYNSTFTGMEF